VEKKLLLYRYECSSGKETTSGAFSISLLVCVLKLWRSRRRRRRRRENKILEDEIEAVMRKLGYC